MATLPAAQMVIALVLSPEDERALVALPGDPSQNALRLLRSRLHGATDTAFLRFRRGLWTLANTAVEQAREAHEEKRLGECFFCESNITPTLDPDDHEEWCPARLASGQLSDFGLWPTGGYKADEPAAPRGSHLYLDTVEREECLWGCGAWLGGASKTTGAPDGVDPYGSCPNAPPIRYPKRARVARKV